MNCSKCSPTPSGRAQQRGHWLPFVGAGVRGSRASRFEIGSSVDKLSCEIIESFLDPRAFECRTGRRNESILRLQPLAGLQSFRYFTARIGDLTGSCRTPPAQKPRRNVVPAAGTWRRHLLSTQDMQCQSSQCGGRWTGVCDRFSETSWCTTGRCVVNYLHAPMG